MKARKFDDQQSVLVLTNPLKPRKPGRIVSGRWEYGNKDWGYLVALTDGTKTAALQNQITIRPEDYAGDRTCDCGGEMVLDKDCPNEDFVCVECEGRCHFTEMDWKLKEAQ